MIRYAGFGDFTVLKKYDRHISESELRNSIHAKRAFGNTFYEKTFVIITLYPNIGNHYAVFELHIKDGKPITETLVANEADNEKALLSKFSVYRHNDKFYQIRDVIHFGTDSFFII